MKYGRRLFALAALVSCTAFPAWSETAASPASSLEGKVWQTTFETQRSGPLEAYLVFERQGDFLRAHTLSGASELLAALPGAATAKADLAKATFSLSFALKPGAELAGQTESPWAGKKVTLEMAGDAFSGKIEGGAFGGNFHAVAVPPAQAKAKAEEKLRDFTALARQLESTISARLYDRRELDTDGYRHFSAQLEQVAKAARDDIDFMILYTLIRGDLPFSHVELRRSPASVEQMMESFDQMRVGDEAVKVEMSGKVATLTVSTMMGVDTIANIDKAYQQIVAAKAEALVIDLRGNGGGAFAVKPLVQHTLSAPVDAGFFISRKWSDSHAEPPTAEQIATIAPWQGWSIIRFWQDVQSLDAVRVQFLPEEPLFKGPVFVAIDGKSASATELAVAAFKTADRVQLVGERTAGQMLSQLPLGIGDGYILSLPIANYFSASLGRIEGNGVAADIESPSADALALAQKLALESTKAK